MPIKKSQHRRIGLNRILAFESVTRSFHLQQLGLDTCCLQFVDDLLCLLERHVIILRAMDAERRRGIRRYPIQRTRHNVSLACLFHIAAQK